MAAVLCRVAQDRVLPGDVRETAEVGGVGELRPAGRDPLVAARADGEAVTLGDRAHRRLEQAQDRDAVRDVMAQHFCAPPRIRAGRPFERPEGEPAGGEPAKARGGEGPVAQEIDDGAGALERRVLQIDTAARIPQRGVAGRLEGSPDRLAQHMGKRTDLGDEGEPPAPDLANGPAAHQNALAGVRPVHTPDLDLGVVPAAVEDVGLGDPIRGQHALCVLRIDRQVSPRPDLGRRQPALRLEIRAVEGQRPVVIGEAEAQAIRAGNPPAP
jgi:hypothetical protein